MTKKELYTCDICHTDYASKEDAIKCEKEHSAVCGVTDIRINAHAQYPHKIEVAFKDGKKLWFRA